MLNLNQTRIVRTSVEALLPGSVVPEEGIALVYVKDNGITKVTPCTGAAGEVYAGVSQSRNSPPGMLPYVQDAVVSANGTVELVRAPIAGQSFIRLAGAPVAVVAGAPANAGEVQLTGTTLKFYAGQATKAVSAQFMYVPTVLEARSIVGDAPLGGLASTAEGIIGLLKDAEFGTNYFDASVDWSSAMFAKLTTGGRFTVGTAADHIPNVIVKNSPTSASPFLLLAANVA